MILHKDRAKDPRLGFARTFLAQLEDVAVACGERGIKIVVNAGGLNPAGCAAAARAIYQKLGVRAQVAHIEGDDLLPQLEALQARGEPLRPPGQGHAARDAEGADPLGERLPRRLGHRRGARARRRLRDLPARHRRGARRRARGVALRLEARRLGSPRVGRRGGPHPRVRRADDRRQLRLLPRGAGARASRASRSPKSKPTAASSSPSTPAPAGSSRSAPSRRSCSTRSRGPAYLSPDVTARFDTISLAQEGPDRVRVSRRARRAAARDDEGLHQPRGRLPQQHDLPAHGPRRRREGAAGRAHALAARRRARALRREPRLAAAHEPARIPRATRRPSRSSASR